jgi:hypothetical protein
VCVCAVMSICGWGGFHDGVVVANRRHAYYSSTADGDIERRQSVAGHEDAHVAYKPYRRRAYSRRRRAFGRQLTRALFHVHREIEFCVQPPRIGGTV